MSSDSIVSAIGEDSRVDMNQIPTDNQGKILLKECSLRTIHESEPNFVFRAPCRAKRREKKTGMCSQCGRCPPRTMTIEKSGRVKSGRCDSCIAKSNQRRFRAIEVGNCARCLKQPPRPGRGSCQKCEDRQVIYRARSRARRLAAAAAAATPTPTMMDEGRREDGAVEGACEAPIAESKNELWKMKIAFTLNP